MINKYILTIYYIFTYNGNFLDVFPNIGLFIVAKYCPSYILNINFGNIFNLIFYSSYILPHINFTNVYLSLTGYFQVVHSYSIPSNIPKGKF